MVHRCKATGSGRFDTERHYRDVAWFGATGHCGGCGQPGVFCLCTETAPCGCRDLHEMGSGRVEGALDQFADRPPVTVSDDQQELFG
jgi:hypothetical protein